MQTKNQIKSLDNNADNVIWQFSILAGLSGATPIPGADMLLDTPLQYAMIVQLKSNYEIDDSFNFKELFAIIIDNIYAKKATRLLISAFKFIPIIGQALGSIAAYIYDFAYTFAIGKIFKKLFREAYLNGTKPDITNIKTIIEYAWNETCDYIKNNWKTIINASKFSLEIYEVDLKKLKNEIIDTNITKNEIIQKNMEKLQEIVQNLQIQKFTTDDFRKELDLITEKLNEPSLDMIKAQVEIAKLKGEKIENELIAFIELLEKKNLFINNIKKEINKEIE